MGPDFCIHLHNSHLYFKTQTILHIINTHAFANFFKQNIIFQRMVRLSFILYFIRINRLILAQEGYKNISLIVIF